MFDLNILFTELAVFFKHLIQWHCQLLRLCSIVLPVMISKITAMTIFITTTKKFKNTTSVYKYMKLKKTEYFQQY
jgi:hypothetical protein